LDMKKIFLAVLCFAPVVAFANVRINEVTWMGDSVSADHEWVELYNDGDSAQSLSGWKLVATDTADDVKVKFTIALSGTITGKGYFLIESKRGNISGQPDTAPYLASDFNTASFSLLNAGETLYLKNSEGTAVDTVHSLASKWPAGDNTTKETMQWNGTKWITAAATPRAENKTVDTTPPDTTTDKETDTTTPATKTTILDTSGHASPLPLSDFSQKQDVYISAGRNRIVPVGNTVNFEAYAIDAKGNKVQGVSAKWSFGDGTEAGGMKVSHTYKHAGDYVVILNANVGGNDAVSRAEVKTFKPQISISLDDDAVTLQNNSAYELNIGNWRIGTFISPNDTIIGAGKKIVLSANIPLVDGDSLYSPDGNIVTMYSKPIMVTASTTPAIIPVPIIEEKIIPVVSVAKPKPAPGLAAAIVAPEPVVETLPAQTITLKKEDGFFSKVWRLFFN